MSNSLNITHEHVKDITIVVQDESNICTSQDASNSELLKSWNANPSETTSSFLSFDKWNDPKLTSVESNREANDNVVSIHDRLLCTDKSFCSKSILHALLTLTLFLTSVIFFGLYVCAIHKVHTSHGLVGKSELIPFLTLIQTNDLYELKASAHGGPGGVTHFTAFMKSLPGKHKLSLFAGDLISPSPMSTIEIDGKYLQGKHMIDVGNNLFDISAFGNHEFDYTSGVLKERLLESRFMWLRTNMSSPSNYFDDLDQRGTTKRFELRRYPLESGELAASLNIDEICVAFVGIAPNYKSFKDGSVVVEDINSTISMLPSILQEIHDLVEVHLVVALTHLNLVDDVQLANAGLGIDLILGGHEHENIITVRSEDHIPITKADSDVRSVYIHKIYPFPPNATDEDIQSLFENRNPTIVRKQKVALVIERTFQEITSSMPTDPSMDQKIDYWWDMAQKGFAAQGYNINEIIYELKERWDLRREWISTRLHTKEGSVFAEAIYDCGCMHFQDNNVKMSFFSSGYIRLDAFLGPTTLTAYDVIRISPFISDVVIGSIRGDHLLKTIQHSIHENKGTGGFMLWSSKLTCVNDLSSCSLDNETIKLDVMYDFYTHDFLLTGKETRLGLLKKDDKLVFQKADRNAKGESVHFQKCVVNYFRKLKDATR